MHATLFAEACILFVLRKVCSGSDLGASHYGTQNSKRSLHAVEIAFDSDEDQDKAKTILERELAS